MLGHRPHQQGDRDEQHDQQEQTERTGLETSLRRTGEKSSEMEESFNRLQAEARQTASEKRELEVRLQQSER